MCALCVRCMYVLESASIRLYNSTTERERERCVWRQVFAMLLKHIDVSFFLPILWHLWEHERGVNISSSLLCFYALLYVVYMYRRANGQNAQQRYKHISSSVMLVLLVLLKRWQCIVITWRYADNEIDSWCVQNICGDNMCRKILSIGTVEMRMNLVTERKIKVFCIPWCVCARV